MKRLLAFLIAALLCLPVAASAWWQSVQQVGVVTGGATYIGPGDIVSGATSFYSCGRAYTAAYANGTNPLCDVVLTTGGAAACTIRAATNGFADQTGSYCAGSTTLASACTGGCSITKMYDQSGNSRDISQATIASMPTLTLGALNSLPCATGSIAKGLLTAASLTLAQPFTFTAVAERTGSFTLQLQIYANGAGGAPNAAYSTSTNTVRETGGSVITATASDSAFHALQFILNNTSSQITVDTTQGTLSAGGTSGFTSTFALMNTSGLSAGMAGFMCEAGIWPSALNATQQTDMNTNIHSATTGWNF